MSASPSVAALGLLLYLFTSFCSSLSVSCAATTSFAAAGATTASSWLLPPSLLLLLLLSSPLLLVAPMLPLLIPHNASAPSFASGSLPTLSYRLPNSPNPPSSLRPTTVTIVAPSVVPVVPQAESNSAALCTESSFVARVASVAFFLFFYDSIGFNH